MAHLDFDLAVIGGGPAGASAAIVAARAGARVLLAERGHLPRHKVCGEFVSPEALGQLAGLLGSAEKFTGVPRIARARIFLDGEVREAPVGPPAASITRYDLDLALWRAAVEAGVDARQQFSVAAIQGSGPFALTTAAGEMRVRAVIDATGRWSNFSADARASNGGATRERWLGIKAHFAESAPADSVDLYFFDGGYCGVQPIAENSVNVCALVRAETARNLHQVFARSRALWRRSRGWEPLTEMMTTSPVFFRDPVPVRGGVLCAGDAAGFIDPFVGDGISLALQSGALAAEVVARCFRGESSMAVAAEAYEQEYRRRFLRAFRNAARLRRLFSLPRVVRAPALAALRWRHVAAWMVAATRTRTQPA